MGELKPCPFCGGKARFVNDSDVIVTVVCEKCEAEMVRPSATKFKYLGKYHKDPTVGVREAWNERAEGDFIDSLSSRIRSQQRALFEQQAYTAKLQAEIERLRKENKILPKNADTAFQDGLNEAQDLYREQVKSEVSAEAIKEFAERLKGAKKYSVERHENIVPVAIIDWIVQEMVGDNNG